MPVKASFSALKLYQECGYKYKLHYLNRKRTRWLSSALAFGSAFDNGLNTLLKDRNLEKAITAFDAIWFKQFVNDKLVELPQYSDMIYGDSDFDEELLLEEDKKALENHLPKYESLRKEKSLKGFKNLSAEDRKLYNLCNWYSMLRKGHIMLKSYHEKVLPHITEVLAVQHESSLKNSEGDEIVQYVDLIVRWFDGSVVLLDNKTTGKSYDKDSYKVSPQLISYYYENKDRFGLTAVGFITINKHIIKNKAKKCTKCGKMSESNRVKTCAFEVEGKRCGGEFEDILQPEAAIQEIIGPVADTAEDLVLTVFDESTQGIKSKDFRRNLSACKNGNFECPYYNMCWFNDESDLLVLPEKKVVEDKK